MYAFNENTYDYLNHLGYLANPYNQDEATKIAAYIIQHQHIRQLQQYQQLQFQHELQQRLHAHLPLQQQQLPFGPLPLDSPIQLPLHQIQAHQQLQLLRHHHEQHQQFDEMQSSNRQATCDEPCASRASSESNRERPKKFPCPHCPVTLSNSGQFRGHLRIHTGERPFVCDAPACNKSFTRNEELTRHKRIHSGIRPYACTTCNKCFGRKDHLKKHLKTHNK